MPLALPTSRITAVSTLGGSRAIGVRVPGVVLPVLGVGEVLAGLLGARISEVSGVPCEALSRCTLSLDSLNVGGVGPTPKAPLPVALTLAGLVGGSWVPLASAVWMGGSWDAVGVLWWSGGLVEGFGLFAGIRSDVVGARQMVVNGRLLVDRGGSHTGAAVGPGVVLL